MLIALASLAAASAAAVCFSCLLSAGGDPWLEPALDPMPDRARLIRWPLPARSDLN